jgi:hypothetical protein
MTVGRGDYAEDLSDRDLAIIVRAVRGSVAAERKTDAEIEQSRRAMVLAGAEVAYEDDDTILWQF